MITIEEVQEIHSTLIEAFGGSHGVRDLDSLRSALARPFQTFDNNALYPSVLERAAALMESLLVNHPFVDGNKRTGYVILRLFLLKYGLDVKASADNKYEFVINVASGALKYDGILNWLTSNVLKQGPTL